MRSLANVRQFTWTLAIRVMPHIVFIFAKVCEWILTISLWGLTTMPDNSFRLALFSILAALIFPALAPAEISQGVTISENDHAFFFESPWLRVGFSRVQPKMTYLSVDAVGTGRVQRNLLKMPVGATPELDGAQDETSATESEGQISERAISSPSPPRSGGLEPLGERRKESARSERPASAERAGASESL